MIRIPKIFSEGCVLQRGEGTAFFGFGQPGQDMRVEFQGQSYHTVCDQHGKFRLALNCIEVGTGFVLDIYSGGESLKILDIAVGDVYLCAGQSNMELPIQRVRERYVQIEENPLVRECKIKENAEFSQELEDCIIAEWRKCSAEQLDAVSAFGFFFCDQQQREKNIPIGFYNISKGGTPIESWLSDEELISAKTVDGQDCLEQIRFFSVRENREKWMKDMQDRMDSWFLEIKRGEERAIGKADYTDASSTDLQWMSCMLPADFKSFDPSIGPCSMIFRKKFFLKGMQESKEQSILRLGAIADSDICYMNGKKVGQTEYRFPPRIYPFASDILREGENEVLLRILVFGEDGRFNQRKEYSLTLPSGEKLDLSGEWEYTILAHLPAAPRYDDLTWKPGAVYKGMLYPLIGTSLRAVIWYQGESNDKNPETYEKSLQRMILSYRDKWEDEKLPFIIISLPICKIDTAGEESWEKLRRAQAAAGKLPYVEVTVNTDLGEENDLHPMDKQEMALRAVEAEKRIYAGII